MMRFISILLVLCFALASCVQYEPAEPYVYQPMATSERPATIEGADIFSHVNGKQAGNIYVNRIDGKQIQDIDGVDENFISLYFFAPPIKGKKYQLSPGKRVIEAMLNKGKPFPFEIVLDVKAGETYKFNVIQSKKEGVYAPFWKIWIEDSRGSKVTKELNLKIHVKMGVV